MKLGKGMLGICAAAVLVALPAVAQMTQDEELAEVIKARIANYREIGTSFKAIDDELKSGKPYEGALVEAAQNIASLSKDIPRWFPAGSGPAPEKELGIMDRIKSFFQDPVDPNVVHGVKTKAKADIWLRPDEFKKYTVRLQDESAKLLELIRAKDMEGFTAQFKVVKDTCDGCHTEFRRKEEL